MNTKGYSLKGNTVWYNGEEYHCAIPGGSFTRCAQRRSTIIPFWGTANMPQTTVHENNHTVCLGVTCQEADANYDALELARQILRGRFASQLEAVRLAAALVEAKP